MTPFTEEELEVVRDKSQTAMSRTMLANIDELRKDLRRCRLALAIIHGLAAAGSDISKVTREALRD